MVDTEYYLKFREVSISVLIRPLIPFVHISCLSEVELIEVDMKKGQ